MAAAPAAPAEEGALQRWQIVVNQEVDFDYLLGSNHLLVGSDFTV